MGPIPRKRLAAHLAIKTSGLLKHVFPFGHISASRGNHRGVSLGWCDLPFGSSTPDVLTKNIVSKPCVGLQGGRFDIIFACLVPYLMIVPRGLWLCCSVHVPGVRLQERYLCRNFRHRFLPTPRLRPISCCMDAVPTHGKSISTSSSPGRRQTISKWLLDGM